MKIKVTEDHISYARWAGWHSPDAERRDAIVTAIRDAGVDDVQMETYWNLIPPNHDWAIWIGDNRYAMTYEMRDYYSCFLIENGSRTEPAVIQFLEVSNTVDVSILPTDSRNPWVKAGMSYMTWHEKQIGGKVEPLTPLWQQQHTFPEWLKAKRITPEWEKE